MEHQTLIQIAIDTLPNSYAPYSRFFVSAALLCKDGTVYTGNNIENVGYSATVCAERTAFFHAVKDGKKFFERIVVCGGKEGNISDYCFPCGICRQVMREFCNPASFQIIVAKSVEDYQIFTLEELLPRGFGPENLL